MNFFIKNLGCKYNSYESNKISELLTKNGYVASSEDDANFIIINTCSVTQVADKKTRQLIRSYKYNNKNAVIVAIGCSVDLNYDELKEYTDILIKNENKFDIVSILKNYLKSYEINDEASIDKTKKQNVRAFVGIQNGCNQFCTYCIIPYLRGRIESDSEDNIINYVNDLVKKGIKEIVYTGIHISSFSLNNNESYENEIDREKARKNLISLLKRTAEIESVKRIRLGSLECRIINDEFLDALNSGKLKEKFCPNFCLSLQSGSDKILKSMNRHYTSKEYEDVVKLIRKKINNALITTDIIVGFPGESDGEYKETLEFIKRSKFYNPNIFPYSKRKGTIAYDYKNQIPNKIKHDRVKELIAISDSIKDEYDKGLINQCKEVLIEEKKIINDKIVYLGYTKEYQYINVIGILKNDIVTDFDRNIDYVGSIKCVKILANYSINTGYFVEN